MPSGYRRRINTPHLERIQIHSFSLYRLQPIVDVRVNPGVFCLAGANGLGKSSFLSALGYGFTGTVAPPKPSLTEMQKYYRDSVTYGQRYFTGRVGELDRKSAAVTLHFKLAENQYVITRGFFEPHALRHFEVQDLAGNLIVKNDPEIDDEDRHDLYMSMVAEHCGLQTFAQFVFLNHYLLTFDERRHLLFWDPRASEQVLYLALGLDSSLAKRAADLRKAANAAGSLARNAQYQATSTRQQLRKVAAALGGSDGGASAEVLASYQESISARREASSERNRLQKDLEDARLELSAASAMQLRLRHEYEEAFRRRFDARTTIRLHPIVTQTLADHRCRVCGIQHESGPERISQALASNACPLCESQLPPAQPADSTAALLTRIDRDLMTATAAATANQQRVERLSKELETAQAKLTKIRRQVSDIENEHGLDSNVLDKGLHEEMQTQLTSLRSAIDAALARKDEQLQLRAQALAAYEPIRNQLLAAWREAELEFVPLFRDLAEGFIGLPLDIQLDEGAGSLGNAHLALTVDTSHRRDATQLSESQRFFLDIALRMALTQFMTAPERSAAIYVDTPEGALDIAYEARAGEMFSTYASAGNQLVMTANVNTSQLLRRLAKRCRAEGMKLVRMTEWTTLSDVQIQEEELFEEAYALIESELGGRDSGDGAK
ncbi:AAA family ATPase [Micromonospora haikouensis]|uniref:AAA family ATPase n=1 Tax=Micromonospora haikouensis TaxID=686309 RepID=UPI0037937BC2